MRPGDLVQVRDFAEISATLDTQGRLDGVPFMPEMLGYCGKTLRVARRADKTCVEGFGMRSMPKAVFLEDVRCDGAQHDGCQRNCLIFWKEAWLKPVPVLMGISEPPVVGATVDAIPVELPTRQSDRFLCQSTELGVSSVEWSVQWSLSAAIADLRAGELSIGGVLGFIWRALINKSRRLVGLPDAGVLAGANTRKFRGDLNLKAGEWIRVKSLDDIKGTLDSKGKNCGLTFEPEMAVHAGRTFRVDFPVEKIILEEKGRMIRLANTVALKGVTCRGLCSQNCPRANPLYWREVWLERVPAP